MVLVSGSGFDYWYQDLVLMLSEANAQLEDDRSKGAHFVSEALQLPEATYRRWTQRQRTVRQSEEHSE